MAEQVLHESLQRAARSEEFQARLETYASFDGARWLERLILELVFRSLSVSEIHGSVEKLTKGLCNHADLLGKQMIRMHEELRLKAFGNPEVKGYLDRAKWFLESASDPIEVVLTVEEILNRAVMVSAQQILRARVIHGEVSEYDGLREQDLAIIDGVNDQSFADIIRRRMQTIMMPHSVKEDIAFLRFIAQQSRSFKTLIKMNVATRDDLIQEGYVLGANEFRLPFRRRWDEKCLCQYYNTWSRRECRRSRSWLANGHSTDASNLHTAGNLGKLWSSQSVSPPESGIDNMLLDAGLDADELNACKLKYFYDMTLEEISTEMSTTRHTVNDLLSRVRMKLERWSRGDVLSVLNRTTSLGVEF